MHVVFGSTNSRVTVAKSASRNLDDSSSTTEERAQQIQDMINSASTTQNLVIIGYGGNATQVRQRDMRKKLKEKLLRERNEKFEEQSKKVNELIKKIQGLQKQLSALNLDVNASKNSKKNITKKLNEAKRNLDEEKGKLDTILGYARGDAEKAANLNLVV